MLAICRGQWLWARWLYSSCSCACSSPARNHSNMQPHWQPHTPPQAMPDCCGCMRKHAAKRLDPVMQSTAVTGISIEAQAARYHRWANKQPAHCPDCKRRLEHTPGGRCQQKQRRRAQQSNVSSRPANIFVCCSQSGQNNVVACWALHCSNNDRQAGVQSTASVITRGTQCESSHSAITHTRRQASCTGGGYDHSGSKRTS